MRIWLSIPDAFGNVGRRSKCALYTDGCPDDVEVWHEARGFLLVTWSNHLYVERPVERVELWTTSSWTIRVAAEADSVCWTCEGS